MLRGAKNTVQGAKMAFGIPFLATCIGVALRELVKANLESLFLSLSSLLLLIGIHVIYVVFFSYQYNDFHIVL